MLSFCRFAGFLLLPVALQADILSIAHRGNSLFAPENTIAALVASHGVSHMVEFDVYPTLDGHLVLMHDSTLNRTTDGSGPVSSWTLAELKELDAGSWFSPEFAGERIPTLAEAIEAILPQAMPLIERKSGTAQAYVAELRRLGVERDVVVQSFDWNFLAAVHALDPSIPLCALGSGSLTIGALQSMAAAGARIVAWNHNGVGPAEIELVRSFGMDIYVWTVNGAAIQRFVNLGVDGIITDDPALAFDLSQTKVPPAASLADNLIAYWDCDDGLEDARQTTLADSIGSSHGTVTLPADQSAWVAEPDAMAGGSLRVDGSTVFATLPQNDVLNINTNEITLSLWVRLDRLPSQIDEPFSAIFDSVEDQYVLYLDRNARELRFKVTDIHNHAARPGIPQAALTTDQWLHVVGVYSGNTGPSGGRAWVYLDGQLQDVHIGHDTGGNRGLTGPVRPGQIAAIGRNGTEAAYFFQGVVDDIAIWTRALTTSEILHVYHRGQAGQPLGSALRHLPRSIRDLSIQIADGGDLEIRFVSDHFWRSLFLSTADTVSGPFTPRPGPPAEHLGEGRFLLRHPGGIEGARFFRVEGSD